MRPPSDTSRARRRQFTRIRHLTQAIFLGSGVASGLLVGYVAKRAWSGAYTPRNYNFLEGTGLYWHFVDLVWIFLFPLLYLIGRHH